MLTYTINDYVSGNTVEVTFVDDEADINMTRKVNAVFTDGEYDLALTTERVEQIAMGVSEKITSGIIGDPPYTPPVPLQTDI